MNLEQGIQLFIKYLFIADFKAIQAGQAPSAVVPAVTTTQTVLTTKFPP